MPSRASQDLKAQTWPVLEKAREFEAIVAEAKRQVGNAVEWYPYDTLSALAHFDHLLGAGNRHVLEPREGARRVLDLGCGDGQMSFFLERLGFDVVAADHPSYNHNGMRGIRALREALGSRIEIHEIDLDALAFPHGSFDLIILLGVLYHLRNPFYALEQMARYGTRCLLSTRVAARLPGGKSLPKDAAWAYLLDENEIAGDDSNYFVFSDAALRLLLKRTHWRVLDYMNTGATENSEPVRLDRDERVFCLIQSEHDRLADLELIEGWYPREDTGWRWTRRNFSALVPVPLCEDPLELAMEVYLSGELLHRQGRFELTIAADGNALAPAVFTQAGVQSFERELPATRKPTLRLDCAANAWLAPDASDPRERGVVVSSIRVRARK
jgi:SAM-dependent methyltransferase